MIGVTISKAGIKCWRKQGQLHRLNGPARIIPSGRDEYWHNGRMHRLNGPARIWADGHADYWLNGIRISEYEHMFITARELI